MLVYRLNKSTEQLKEQILSSKKYVLCLLKRLALLNTNYANKTPFEKNEIAIAEFETREIIVKKLAMIKKWEGELKRLTQSDVSELHSLIERDGKYFSDIAN